MTNRCCDEYSFNLYYYVILSIYFRRNISRDGYANRSSCYTCATFESCSRRRGREITSRGKRGRRKKKRKANKGKCTGRVSTKELSRTMAATVDAQFPAFPRFPREICPWIPYDTRKLCHLSKASGENFGKLGWFFHNNVACNGISSNE